MVSSLSALEALRFSIDNTEKFVSFRLDSARNRLLKVDVIATASATALGVGQLVSGIFGTRTGAARTAPAAPSALSARRCTTETAALRVPQA